MIDSADVGIVYNEYSQAAREMTESLKRRLHIIDDIRVWSSREIELPDTTIADLKVVITVGGDGTILRTARLAGPEGVSILGVNLGRLGFMTELSADDALERVPWYLEEHGWVEKRSMLQANVVCTGTNKRRRSEKALYALNDIAVGRSGVARLVHVCTRVDDVELTTFGADAVIVATATGSTGYSLSAGGPILYPQSRDIVVKAVAPHLSLSPAAVLPSDTMVELEIMSAGEAVVTADGYMDIVLEHGDVVKVAACPWTANFLRAQSPSYFFSTIMQRLRLDGMGKHLQAMQ